MERGCPVFSIIIPTHNRPAQLGACLRSLASLHYPRDRFEVIVVDDGSTLPPDAALTEVRGRLDTQLIKGHRRGPAAARNAGAARARGEFLAFTDDDCAPDRGWLDALAARFANHPDHLLGGSVLNALPSNPYAAASQAILDVAYAHFNAGLERALFVTTNNFAVRADLFRAMGGFDATFLTSEDREFCDRWSHRGLPITYVPEAIVHHARPHTLRTFLRQHFNYGRGTFRFHQARAGRDQSPVRADRTYYAALLRYPFTRALGWSAWWIAALFGAAHGAKVAGFLREGMAARIGSMARPPVQQGRGMLDGTVAVFGAEALLLPTGLLIVAVLTRRLGPGGYGIFSLVATLVAWIEWSITAALARPTIKFIGEAGAWRGVATSVLWLHTAASGIAAGALWLLASPLAALLGEPALSGYVRLFAVDLPIFGLAHAHRHILVGLGNFRARALGSAARWLTRLCLVVVFVQMGLAITGAILGSIGGSVAELVVTRLYVRPRFRWRPACPVRPILNYAVPLFLAGISMRLFDRLDLYALRVLGGTTEQVGFYAAAQNLTLLTGILAVSFAPLLLATLSHAIAAGNISSARATAQEAMRIVIGLLPVAGMAAGAAPGIVALVVGHTFALAAPLFAVLVFGAQALLMVAITTTILTAAGKPGLTLVLTAPAPALAAGGYLWLVPRLGAVGAAIVTTTCAVLLAATTVVAVYCVWQVLPPRHTVWRSLATCALAYGVAVRWTAPGWLLLVKLAVIAVLIAVTYAALGEFRRPVLRPAA